MTLALPTPSEDDPEQYALWALNHVPMSDHVYQPLLMEEQMARRISRHLYICGFRHHPELQTMRFRAPARGGDNPLNGAGLWVDINDPDPDPIPPPDLSQLTFDEQQAIIDELSRLGRLPGDEPDTSGYAEVLS